MHITLIDNYHIYIYSYIITNDFHGSIFHWIINRVFGRAMTWTNHQQRYFSAAGLGRNPYNEHEPIKYCLYTYYASYVSIYIYTCNIYIYIYYIIYIHTHYHRRIAWHTIGQTVYLDRLDQIGLDQIGLDSIQFWFEIWLKIRLDQIR